MTDDAPRNPFAVVDAPDRDKVLGWTGVKPLPDHGVRLADGVWVESIADVIYQLPKIGR